MVENVHSTVQVEDSNEELKQKIVELTEQLDTTIKALDSLSYSVSHDLKAPLRAISGFSGLLFEEYENKLDGEGKHFLNNILRNVRHMDQLIDDLLKYSRASNDSLYMERIDTLELVKSNIEELKNDYADRSITIHIGSLPDIFGDRIMFQKAFYNILSNAFKFTRDKDIAVIEIGCRESDNENTFYIKDNGVGFDMKYSGKLFGMFQRLHTEEEFEGMGAGIAIAQRIIQRHGGKAWIQGEIDKGATFNFSLPI